ncbi:hypothetical protein CcaverHIS002_0208330 [Cutaneotrichosporon cavernicola]|nr:hypothetical protein CcaverHIS002_0208330 [Cutaneotrichosporon cavernicola]
MAINWTWVWVSVTTSLIAFISYTSQIWVFWPWYGREWSWDFLKIMIPFNLCVAMVWWNYRLCVITPPGHVPAGWRPDASGEGIEVKRGNYAPRYCKMCDHFKPPRAHHCRQCKTCVLKLDHHCPWIANCVGFYNHGHFIRFLLWVDIATTFHLVLMAGKVYEFVKEPWMEPTLTELLMMVFNFAACVPVWLCVGMFSIYHVWLVSSNTTTIERWEKDKVSTLVRRGKITAIRFPYNVGFMGNMRSVLGPRWYTWLWPQQMQGTGLSYAVNPEAGESSVQYMWPPREQHSEPVPLPMGSPFVYGDGFNPALKASSGARRARDGCATYTAPWETAVDEDGNAIDDESDGTSSTPEFYLSDYDDEDEPLAYTSARVRRGSEGWEVRPASVGGGGPAGWNAGVAQLDALAQAHTNAQYPWQRPGRYNVYSDEV